MSPSQKRALALARRGDLVRCRHGYKIKGGDGERVSASTIWSLLVRGWLVVAAADPDGTPSMVQAVGAQIEMPFQEPASG